MSYWHAEHANAVVHNQTPAVDLKFSSCTSTSWEYFASGCAECGIDYTVVNDWLGGRSVDEVLRRDGTTFVNVTNEVDLMWRTRNLMGFLDKLYGSLFMSFMETPNNITKRPENLLWIAYTCSIDPSRTFTYFSSLTDEVMQSAFDVVSAFDPLHLFIIGRGDGFPLDMNPLGFILNFGHAWDRYVQNMRMYIEWGQARDLPRYERLIKQCFHWCRIMGYSVDPDAMSLVKEIKCRYEESLAAYRKRSMGKFDVDEMLRRCKTDTGYKTISFLWDDMFMGQGCFRAVVMRYKKMVHCDRVDIPSERYLRIGVEVYSILECVRLIDNVGDELNLEPPCFHGVGVLMLEIIGRLDWLSDLWALSRLDLDVDGLKRSINNGAFIHDKYPEIMTMVLERVSYMLVEPSATHFREFKAVMQDSIARIERVFVMRMFSALFESVRYLYWEGKKTIFNEYMVNFPATDSDQVVGEVTAYFDDLVKNRGLGTKNAAGFFNRSILYVWNSIPAGNPVDRAHYMRTNLLHDASLSGVFSVFIGGVVRWLCESGARPSFYMLPEMFMLDYCDMGRMVDCFNRVLPAMSLVSVLWTIYHKDVVVTSMLHQCVSELITDYIRADSCRDIDWFVCNLLAAVTSHHTGNAASRDEILKLISMEGVKDGSMGGWIRTKLSHYVVQYVMSDIDLPFENWMLPLKGFHDYIRSLLNMFRRLIRFHFKIHGKRYGEIARMECKNLIYAMTLDSHPKRYKSGNGSTGAVCNGTVGAGRGAVDVGGGAV